MERRVIYLWELPEAIRNGYFNFPFSDGVLIFLLIAAAVLIAAYIGLIATVIRRMNKSGMPTEKKFMWALIIVFLNLVGCEIFLAMTRQYEKEGVA